ncbi:MAG: hypothetical protein WCI18_14360 [Pseudomonadota bacterium]
MMNRLAFIVLSFLVLGCTKMCSTSRKDMTPEEVVEGYLNTTLNMTKITQVNDLVSYTLGNLRQVLQATPNETFQKVFIDKSYKLHRFTIVERKDITPREAEITYQLQFNQFDSSQNINESNAALMTTEHTLSLIKKDSVWYIQDLLGSKANIEFPVVPESTITPTNGPSSPE